MKIGFWRNRALQHGYLDVCFRADAKLASTAEMRRIADAMGPNAGGLLRETRGGSR